MHSNRLIEYLEDALRTCHGGLQDIVLFRQVTHGQEETIDVLQVCHQRAQRQCSNQHSSASVPDNQRYSQRAQEIRNGAERDEVEQRAHRLREVIAVEIIEAFVVALLAVKQLHNVHAADVFRDVGIDAGQAHANRAEVITHRYTEIRGDPEERGHDDECHQRQLPVNHQQQHRNTENGQHIAKNGDRAGGEHLV